MMLPWMLYALLVGGLVAVAAWMLESALRLRGLPGRWMWAGALLATVALSAAAPSRSVEPTRLPMKIAATAVYAHSGSDSGPAQGLEAAARQVLGTVQEWVDAPLRLANTLLQSLPFGKFGVAVAVGWMMMSGGLLFAFGAVIHHSRRARRGWPRFYLCGTSVRVAPEAGPLVAGMLRPEIVVPRWLLAVPEGEQRLVIAHEQQHLRARDPLLLAASCLMVALLPWHPAVWWMAARLRLAVEVDCDARVLRDGVGRGRYWTVLLNVADRRTGRLLGAPAFLESPAQLERRLTMMTSHRPRFGTVRSLGLAALSCALLIAACDQEMPTASEIDAMDVAAAEERMTRFRIPVGSDENTIYFVDGEQVDAEEAKALGSDEIATIEVHGTARPGETGKHRAVQIRTVEAMAAIGETTQPMKVRFRQVGPSGPPTNDLAEFGGILVIDGVIAEPSALRTLEPDQIATVEVIKGDAAAHMFDNPRAQNGVIRVTTKAASNPQ